MKRFLSLATLPLALVACVELDSIDPARPNAYPTAGLYTPQSTLGASDPTDTPNPAAGLGARCAPLAAVPQGVPAHKGTLTVTYTTQTQDGRYAPKNCSAAWIETLEGAYVATIELRAALRRPGLVFWQDRACTQKLGPDVVSSATLKDHQKPHELSWTGVDFDGKPIPDGMYNLFIEVTETDKQPGELYMFGFDKAGEAYNREVGVDGYLVTLSLDWNPDPLAEPPANMQMDASLPEEDNDAGL